MRNCEITKERNVHRVFNLNGNVVASQTFCFSRKYVDGKAESQKSNIDVGGNSVQVQICLLKNVFH